MEGISLHFVIFYKLSKQDPSSRDLVELRQVSCRFYFLIRKCGVDPYNFVASCH